MLEIEKVLNMYLCALEQCLIMLETEPKITLQVTTFVDA